MEGTYNLADRSVDRIKISFDVKICKLAYKISDNEGKKHKKYSRLTHSIMNNYILSKLKDIKIKGAQRAREALMDVMKMPMNAADELYKTTGISMTAAGELIYRIAKGYNLENLTVFFTNMVYGGMISRRDIYGEVVGVICFEALGDDRASETPDRNYIAETSQRVRRAAREIDRLIGQGSGIVVICGVREQLFASEMLYKYKSNADIAFILIESPNLSERIRVEDRAAAYPEHLLSSIDKLNNIMVILSDAKLDLEGTRRSGRIKYTAVDGNGAWREHKHRALESYGILHGEYRLNSDGGEGRASGFGEPVFSFRRDLSLQSSEIYAKADDFVKNNCRAPRGKGEWGFKAINNALGALPADIAAIIRTPKLPMIMPDLFELLAILQYFATNGRLNSLTLTVL